MSSSGFKPGSSSVLLKHSYQLSYEDTKEVEYHVQGLQVAVDLAGHDYFGEVVNLFSQDLFSDAFIVGLVFIEVKIEGHGQE